MQMDAKHGLVVDQEKDTSLFLDGTGEPAEQLAQYPKLCGYAIHATL